VSDEDPEDDDRSPAIVGWRALFDTADLNLFSAKRLGRNRVRAPGGAPAEDDDGTDNSGDAS